MRTVLMIIENVYVFQKIIVASGEANFSDNLFPCDKNNRLVLISLTQNKSMNLSKISERCKK